MSRSDFLAVFRAHADATGAMSFARFMELALYHPDVGYYRRERARVGYGRGTDFYTSSSSGAVFGQLVTAACESLLRAAGRNPAEHTFVEIGPETPAGALAGIEHPFARSQTFRVDDKLSLEGPCVVFSNELFDAQPCVRTVFRGSRWHEVAVRLEDGHLREIEWPADFPDRPTSDPYHFDRPLAATALAEQIAQQPWTGLFVAIDYGKTYRELTESTPAGTARAYYQHTQSNDLLARPGEQDLTCHVCWDWLSEALRRNGFSDAGLDFQETFFIRHAGAFIAAASAEDAARFTPRKVALLQLLHPSRMGQKFQVLHALR